MDKLTITKEEIHERDLVDVIKKRTLDSVPGSQVIELLIALHECIGTMTCVDYSLQERCDDAEKAQALIESYVGPVHWMRGGCYEGECAICDARDADGPPATAPSPPIAPAQDEKPTETVCLKNLLGVHHVWSAKNKGTCMNCGYKRR
jgi:hypothetical protein